MVIEAISIQMGAGLPDVSCDECISYPCQKLGAPMTTPQPLGRSSTHRLMGPLMKGELLRHTSILPATRTCETITEEESGVEGET